MQKFDVYNDISKRTKGELYVGVVGPVRTGKSTFIEKAVDLLVLPNIKDEYDEKRTLDELPLSGNGRTIMTTEPKFVPSKAVPVNLLEDITMNVRLVDCVGFMVNGAYGHMENDLERMVKTPWFDYEIPFTKAAEIGTRKVINDHSSIGIVITCDNSFSEIPEEAYNEPLEITINELKNIGKPFIVLYNSSRPYDEETKEKAKAIEEKYNVSVFPVNIAMLKLEDITRIFYEILKEFEVSKVEFMIPKWIEMLENTHWLKNETIECAKSIAMNLHKMKDADSLREDMEFQHINNISILKKDYSTGIIRYGIDVDETFYYEIMSELTGCEIKNEYELISTLKYLKDIENDYAKVKDAMCLVDLKGYGVVIPKRDEIELENPTVIKNGNKYGIKIKAKAPSIHLIKADVSTEIAPIVGSEEQAKDLLSFISKNQDSEEGIWDTNIFGKTIEQIVYDGISMKIDRLSDETRYKMQDTISKITNESKGGVICIII